MANAEGKLSVGYGAEAGFMNPPLKAFREKITAESPLYFCRNKASETMLEDFNIRTSGRNRHSLDFQTFAQRKGSVDSCINLVGTEKLRF
jgi:hypothetical protein